MRYMDAQHLKRGDTVVIKTTKETKMVQLVSIEYKDRQVIIVTEDGKNYGHRKVVREKPIAYLANP